MTKTEALIERPCCKCKHRQSCEIVDFIYSPCHTQSDDDYHAGFEPASIYTGEDND